jgi:hypothetical protein
MDLSPDILFIVYPLLSLRDASSLSQINKTANREYKLYLKNKRYTPTNVRCMKLIFRGWKIKIPHRKRLKYNNSWIKSPKDPERPILLF